MKRLFIFLLALFSLISFGQKKYQFELKNKKSPYTSTKCLTPRSDYTNLKLELVKATVDEIEDATLSIELDTIKTYKLTSYKQFKNLDLLVWLRSHNAFSDFKKVKFNLEIKLADGTKQYQSLLICLRKNTINSPKEIRKIREKEKRVKAAKKEKLAANKKLKKRKTKKKALTKLFKKKNYIEIPVSFATDRTDTKNSNVNKRFNGKRAEVVQYGKCVVSIPYTHKLGNIERPSFWRLEFSENAEKHVVLQSIKMQNKDDYFNEMSERISKNGKSTFLFVHGYNVSFADAARRTAQITFDLRFNGEPVFYSWPSQGKTTAYTIDAANIEWAKLNIKNFLKDYLIKSEADNIYLVAHSMGNRGLTTALIELMNENPELKSKITEVILAAPDIDADVFKREIAPKMVQKITNPITLYVSSDDLALIASRKVHGNKRAGDAGDDVVIVEGVETIDASGIDTSFLSHSYFATTSAIIADILDLIKSGKRAKDRETLEKVSKENVIYWKVKQHKN